MTTQGAAAWVVVCLWAWITCVSAQSCNSEKPACIKTVRAPYYEEVCSNDVLCAEIDVPCGTVEERFFCNFDEICVKRQRSCVNATLGEDDPECAPTYHCEWRPYWDIDLEMFSTRCTEYYTLEEGQTCGDAMAKFILPWKVFSGFNPDIDCKEVGEGDRVCVHAVVEPKRPPCGNRRCKIGERCLHTDCTWRPRYGDRCGETRCPLGYACSEPVNSDCGADDGASTHGKFYFHVTTTTTDFESATKLGSTKFGSTESSSRASSASSTATARAHTTKFDTRSKFGTHTKFEARSKFSGRAKFEEFTG